MSWVSICQQKIHSWKFNWSIVDLQCCANFCCAAQWFSYMHVHIQLYTYIFVYICGSDGKESACSVGDPCSIPGSGRSPGEGNGTPFQYPCPENPMDRGAWQATVYRVIKRHNWSDFTFTFHFHTFFSIIVYYRILNIVPYAIWEELVYPFHVYIVYPLDNGYSLSILYIVVCIWLIPNSQSFLLLLPSPLNNYTPVLHVCEFVPGKQKIPGLIMVLSKINP